MVNQPMLQAFTNVAFVTVVMCLTVYLDYFKSAFGIDIGITHYAERVIPSWKPYLPRKVQMPFNSIINCGYVIIGAAWCAAVTIMLNRAKITQTDAFCFFVFNLASCCYGPIQFLRILSQLHGFGVLDQWYTLPFFMWIFNWGLYLTYGWNSSRTLALTVISVFSYVSVLYYRYGFEICLGIHIFLALVGAILAWRSHPQAKVAGPYSKALISCIGFVGFKLLDHKLLKYHLIFRYITGHFISKIFDIGQIYFCNMFFLGITLAAYKDSKKKLS